MLQAKNLQFDTYAGLWPQAGDQLRATGLEHEALEPQ
jgi:hypothetical protein